MLVVYAKLKKFGNFTIAYGSPDAAVLPYSIQTYCTGI